jgi:hypothetical protein
MKPTTIGKTFVQEFEYPETISEKTLSTAPMNDLIEYYSNLFLPKLSSL